MPCIKTIALYTAPWYPSAMPLSPAVRRDRRAAAQPPKNFPRKHCANCNRLFPVTQPKRKFCCSNCKDQFHNFGSAFGPLRCTLENLVAKWLRDFRKETEARFKAIEGRLTMIELFNEVNREQ